MRKKIGLMGGTFNPIHFAHLAMAERATDVFELEETWFMPSKSPMYKDNSNILPEHHRMNMVKLAIEGNERFRASDIEFLREGPTYTADTLKVLNELYPDYDFFFIIGGDSLMNFETWVRPEEISARCTVAACIRGGYAADALIDKTKELSEKFKGEFVYFSFPESDISSTYIRKSVEEGNSVKYLVPDSVINYIYDNRLYTSRD